VWVVLSLFKDLVVYESVVGSCFNLKNLCLFSRSVSFHSIKWLLCCEWIFDQNLLAYLKQLGEKLKGDVWLLDCLIRSDITLSQKRDLHVRRTRK